MCWICDKRGDCPNKFIVCDKITDVDGIHCNTLLCNYASVTIINSEIQHIKTIHDTHKRTIIVHNSKIGSIINQTGPVEIKNSTYDSIKCNKLTQYYNTDISKCTVSSYNIELIDIHQDTLLLKTDNDITLVNSTIRQLTCPNVELLNCHIEELWCTYCSGIDACVINTIYPLNKYCEINNINNIIVNCHTPNTPNILTILNCENVTLVDTCNKLVLKNSTITNDIILDKIIHIQECTLKKLDIKNCTQFHLTNSYINEICMAKMKKFSLKNSTVIFVHNMHNLVTISGKNSTIHFIKNCYKLTDIKINGLICGPDEFAKKDMFLQMCKLYLECS